MKTTMHHLLSILMISAIGSNAMAGAPTIDSFNIQSYLKLSNNAAVSATSADFVFAIFKGSNCIWAKRYSAVSINTGVMNQKISGAGTNIASINNASAIPGECVSNFSGTALDATLLNTGSPAALNIRVYAETTIDTYKPIWDIPLNSAPTAFIAEMANTATTATTANDLAAGVKITTSAGASDVGKFPILNASGQIDNSMINSAALTIANTQVTGLGTAATANTGTTVGTIPLLGASGRLGAAQMPTYTANRMLATDGSGVITSGYDTATVGGGADANKLPLLNGSGQLPNAMIDSASLTPNPANLTTVVPVTKGGTGLATITANGLMVGAGTGNVTTIAPSTSGNVLYSNGTAWLSGTKATAGIVDTSTAQAAIAGNKTFTGVVTHSSTTTLTGAVTATGATTFGTSMKVGTANGTAYTQMKTCTIASAAMATGTSSVACAGVTTAAVMHCSPSVVPPAPSAGNAWVVIPYVSAAGTIAINVTQIGTPSAWTTAWNCVAMQ